MLNIKQALREIDNNVRYNEKITVPLLAGLNRILAADIVAGEKIPPFDKSAVDGYGVKLVDACPGKKLAIVESVAAGSMYNKDINIGETIRVMTGAPIPPGVETIIPQEQVQEKKRGIIVQGNFKKGENIFRRGDKIKEGEVIYRKGMRLTPSIIEKVAAVGYDRAKIYRPPTVAILTTGDELINIEENLTPGKIRNSNSYFLAARIKMAGAIPEIIGIARDNSDQIKTKIKAGLKTDILITTGGVSEGDFDLTLQVYRSLKMKIYFTEVFIEKKKKIIFALDETTPVFGLPGRPAGVKAGFEEFVLPAINKMSGGVINY